MLWRLHYFVKLHRYNSAVLQWKIDHFQFSFQDISDVAWNEPAFFIKKRRLFLFFVVLLQVCFQMCFSSFRLALIRSRKTTPRVRPNRPFLTQSHSASRKRSFSTGLFFDWIILVLLSIVIRVDFIVFVLFLEAVGVREYCCMAVENRLAALCFVRSSRARDELSSKRVGAIGLAESRQSYVRGVALSREP